jgi:hypothetical protein
MSTLLHAGRQWRGVAEVRRWAMQRAIQIALSLLAVSCFVGCKAPRSGDDSSYRTFQAQGKSYFIQVARDCDSLLREHPPGSVGLEPHARAAGFFKLSTPESALPASIKALQPDYILVSTNQLWVNCGGGGRMDWGFMWERCSDPITNTWALRSCVPYGFERTLYVESR